MTRFRICLSSIMGVGGLLIVQPSMAQSLPAQPKLDVANPPDLAVSSTTLVSQLTDVQPSDWAFQALQGVVERYRCLKGYPDQTFLGQRPLTRSEFAAALNACLDGIQQQFESADNSTPQEQLVTLQRLQADFAPELAALAGRVNQLDQRLSALASQQFSPTTKLTGLAIFAVNGGGFTGNRLVAPRGATITQNQPNVTSLYRVSFDLNTSFKGSDLLKLRLLAASPGSRDNAAGFLEPNLGSGLDFAVPGRTQLSLGRFYYTFKPMSDLSVTLGPQMVAPDFIDRNRYANTSFRDFSTVGLVNNFILLPRPGGAGAAIDWNPKKGPISLRAVYIASSASLNLPENQQFFGGGSPNDILLFPVTGGGSTGGLFGDPYMGVVELEYAPTKALTLRFQYSGGELLGSHFRVFGANIEFTLTPKIGLFARYGYGRYPNTILGDIHPQYWSAGIAFQNLVMPNDIAGIGIAQPFILGAVGNATQTNFEVFYNIPLGKNLRLSPLLQVISHPANQSSNGTIFTGTLRTVFTF
jgi:Carbohydrate-selective porin, OprB family/S-layer homology domain